MGTLEEEKCRQVVVALISEFGLPETNNFCFTLLMKSDSTTHDVFDFMHSVTNDLAAEYERIWKRAKDDPGTAGDQGEENWASLLRNWLPPIFQVVTKGRILSATGGVSPQVDVIVLSPAYPNFLLDKKLYLAGGVLAAFECKITLKSAHIGKAVETANKIQELSRPRMGTPYRELHNPILYGLLAHSHNWKRGESGNQYLLIEKLRNEDKKHVKAPRNMLDILCVADFATFTATKLAFGCNKIVHGQSEKVFAATVFSGHTSGGPQSPGFTPIGSMLSYLFERLAWESESIRPMAEYFRNMNLRGYGSGNARYWDSSVFSEETLLQLKMMGVSERIRWDEWSHWFP